MCYRIIAVLALAVSAPAAPPPAAAAVVERVRVPGTFHKYDDLSLTGSTEVGRHDFYVRIRAAGIRSNIAIAEFFSDGFHLPDGVRAKVTIFSECCATTAGGRFVRPFEHTYVDEDLQPIARAASVGANPSLGPIKVRIAIKQAPPGAGPFTWNAEVLPTSFSPSHTTVIDANGVAITPLPATALLLAPGLGGLALLARRRRRAMPAAAQLPQGPQL